MKYQQSYLKHALYRNVHEIHEVFYLCFSILFRCFWITIMQMFVVSGRLNIDRKCVTFFLTCLEFVTVGQQQCYLSSGVLNNVFVLCLCAIAAKRFWVAEPK